MIHAKLIEKKFKEYYIYDLGFFGESVPVKGIFPLFQRTVSLQDIEWSYTCFKFDSKNADKDSLENDCFTDHFQIICFLSEMGFVEAKDDLFYLPEIKITGNEMLRIAPENVE